MLISVAIGGEIGAKYYLGLGTPPLVVPHPRIAGGDTEPLKLGNLAVKRDWGWAPEYVEAMHIYNFLDG